MIIRGGVARLCHAAQSVSVSRLDLGLPVASLSGVGQDLSIGSGLPTHHRLDLGGIGVLLERSQLAVGEAQDMARLRIDRPIRRLVPASRTRSCRGTRELLLLHRGKPLEPRVAAQGVPERINPQPRGTQGPWSREDLFQFIDGFRPLANQHVDASHVREP